MVYRYYFTSVLRPKASVLGSLMAEVLERKGRNAFFKAHEVYDAWRAGEISYNEARKRIKQMLK
jgi:hypothetical protein